jgi:hypothetical protein
MNHRVSTPQNRAPSPLVKRNSATAQTSTQRPGQSSIAQRKAAPTNSTTIAATTAPLQRPSNGIPKASASYRDAMPRGSQSSSWSGRQSIPNGSQSSNASHRQSLPNGNYPHISQSKMPNGIGGTNGVSSPYGRRASSQGIQADVHRRLSENAQRPDMAVPGRQSFDPSRPPLAHPMRRSTLPP